jgi:hypothetical protein
MVLLAQQIPTLFLGAASALGNPQFVPSWSTERIQSFQLEGMARFHYETRLSAQLADEVDEANDEYEFEAIPLVAAQIVRVRFRAIGPLPPPAYFKNEPVLDE